MAISILQARQQFPGKTDEEIYRLAAEQSGKPINEVMRQMGLSAEVAGVPPEFTPELAPEEMALTAKDYFGREEQARQLGVLQGPTLGHGDELIGALRAGLDTFSGRTLDTYGSRYTRRRDEARELQQQRQQEFPSQYLAGELAGGLALGGVGAGKAMAGQTLRQAAPRLTGIGTLFGAGVGSGYSEVSPFQQPGQYAMDIGVGAGLGGAIGLGAPALGTGVKAAARKLTKKGLTPDEAAQGWIAERMRERGVSRTEAEALFKANPEAAMADVVPELAATVLERAPQGGAGLETFLNLRQRGQYDRIMDATRRAAGLRTSFVDDSTLQAAKARDIGGRLYTRARDQRVKVTEKMEDILSSEFGLDALKVARRGSSIRGYGRDMPARARVDMNNMFALDDTLKSMDDMVNSAYKGQGKYADVPADIKAVRNDFRQELYDQNKTYRRARKQWAGLRSDEEALDLGKRVYREHPDVLQSRLKDMSKSELAQYRVGAQMATEQKFGNIANASDLTKAFDKPNVQRVLRELYGDKGYKMFERQLRNEKRMMKVRSAEALKQPQRSKETAFANIARLGGFLGGGALGIPGGQFASRIAAGEMGKQLGRRADVSAQQKLMEMFNRTGPMLRGQVVPEISAGQNLLGLAGPVGLGMTTMYPTIPGLLER